jgi:transposase
LFGVGSDSAGALLVAAGDNPGRLRSNAAFAMLCGASPIQASSGKTRRLREGKSKKESIRCLKRLMWPGRCSLSSHDESPLP